MRTRSLRDRFIVAATAATLAAATAACATTPPEERAPPETGPRTVQPGAPGEPSRPVSPKEASTDRRYAEADVHFMQRMIAHHEQALEMSRMVPERSDWEDLHRLARRIEVSQGSEIELMESWLDQRGEPSDGARDIDDDDGPHRMAGMLSEEEMAELEAASGAEFERRFLELMIRHHEGALAMVDQLLSTPGAAQGVEIFQLASHVEADQAAEIARMRAMRASVE